MKDFNYYLEEGYARRVKKDLELAKSLKIDAIKRAKNVLQLDIDKFSKIIFENIYDSLRELLDSVLAIDGYKSYSHEASIAYLKNEMEDSVLVVLDEFRYKRNSSKYYGKEIDTEDAKKIAEFWRDYSEKLIGLIDKKMEGCSDE
jgi:hypothetical protein